MSASTVALTGIFAIVIIGTAIGLYAGARRKMDLEQWTVGGRGFGAALIWLLMAGEIYTTFTFLGASGWVYSRGAPALYILAYQPLAYIVSFYILPRIWEAGRKHGLQTQADFFRVRYGSKPLAIFVAVVGIAFIIPYLQLQLTGLGIIVEVASFQAIGRTPAMLIAFTLVAGFVFTSGVRGVAWVSILKDGLLLLAVLFIGIAIPYIHFGGVAPLFAAVASAKPEQLVMPGATRNLGHAWFVSTVLLSALGFYMWPFGFGATLTARSADTLRRNAILLPLYSITVPLILFVGLTALLVVPGLANGDLSLLTLVRQTFPPWLLGVIGGAGALTAMVPAAMMILTAATLFAKNVWRPLFAPAMSDSSVAALARAMVPVITAVALFFAIFSSTTLVSLLLLGYAGVTQFFPGVVLGLYSKRVTAAAIFSGLVVGIAIVAALMLSGRDPYFGVNAGFIALCANFAVVAGLSLLQPAREVAAPEAVRAIPP